MRVDTDIILDITSSGAHSYYSDPIGLQHIMSYAVQVNFSDGTQSPSGTLKLQCSNDNPAPGSNFQGPILHNWTTLPSGTWLDVTGSGSYMFNNTIVGYQWARLEYDQTITGTATVQARMYIKGN